MAISIYRDPRLVEFENLSRAAKVSKKLRRRVIVLRRFVADKELELMERDPLILETLRRR